MPNLADRLVTFASMGGISDGTIVRERKTKSFRRRGLSRCSTNLSVDHDGGLRPPPDKKGDHHA
jgi:hypothetical protein